MIPSQTREALTRLAAAYSRHNGRGFSGYGGDDIQSEGSTFGGYSKADAPDSYSRAPVGSLSDLTSAGAKGLKAAGKDFGLARSMGAPTGIATDIGLTSGLKSGLGGLLAGMSPGKSNSVSALGMTADMGTLGQVGLTGAQMAAESLGLSGLTGALAGPLGIVAAPAATFAVNAIADGLDARDNEAALDMAEDAEGVGMMGAPAAVANAKDVHGGGFRGFSQVEADMRDKLGFSTNMTPADKRALELGIMGYRGVQAGRKNFAQISRAFSNFSDKMGKLGVDVNAPATKSFSLSPRGYDITRSIMGQLTGMEAARNKSHGPVGLTAAGIDATKGVAAQLAAAVARSKGADQGDKSSSQGAPGLTAAGLEATAGIRGFMSGLESRGAGGGGHMGSDPGSTGGMI